MFEYEIKGITLNLSEMVSIYNHYIASCTAEYLLENGYANNEKEVFKYCNYRNLQLLKAEDNLHKGAKLDYTL